MSTPEGWVSVCGILCRGWSGHVVPASPEIHEDKDHSQGKERKLDVAPHSRRFAIGC
jgi:hypothetical protein